MQRCCREIVFQYNIEGKEVIALSLLCVNEETIRCFQERTANRQRIAANLNGGGGAAKRSLFGTTPTSFEICTHGSHSFRPPTR
jgi:hypothetical protein